CAWSICGTCLEALSCLVGCVCRCFCAVAICFTGFDSGRGSISCLRVPSASSAVYIISDGSHPDRSADRDREASSEYLSPVAWHGVSLRQNEGKRSMSRIAVMGSGAWGTAIALSLANRGGHDLTLWSHSRGVSETIAELGENTTFLPGFSIPRSILATPEIEVALRDAEIVVSVMPSHHVRASYEQFAPFLRSGQLLVSATKGIEDESLQRMSEVIADVLRKFDLTLPVGVLSGPSFAQEVAAG